MNKRLTTIKYYMSIEASTTDIKANWDKFSQPLLDQSLTKINERNIKTLQASQMIG